MDCDSVRHCDSFFTVGRCHRCTVLREQHGEEIRSYGMLYSGVRSFHRTSDKCEEVRDIWYNSGVSFPRNVIRAFANGWSEDMLRYLWFSSVCRQPID